METVLLIEDDEALGRQVIDHLERAGLSARWWQRGRVVTPEDLRDVVLVVLDLMLPDRPGLSMLRDIRAVSDVPVLVLSARQSGHDKVDALTLGADDFVTKPFWPEELIARVQARLRRPMMERDETLTLGTLVLDVARQEARYADQALSLTRAEYALLLALARRVDRPVSRQWLLDNVLDPERGATERTLDVHISRLRKKLGSPGLIKTVWGIGYRLSVPA